jgi:hypothetical protein
VDTRLRQLIREAVAHNDPLLGYQAAAYAAASGQLPQGDWKFFKRSITTPNGPVVVTINNHYSHWGRDGQPRMWQNLELQNGEPDRGWNHSLFSINDQPIHFNFRTTLELLHQIPEARRLHGSGRTNFPPARRARIAQHIVELVRPSIMSEEGQAWIRACALMYMSDQVLSNLNMIVGHIDHNITRLQKEVGSNYQALVRFKEKYMGVPADPRLEELDLHDLYVEVEHLLASGQLAEQVDRHEIDRTRNFVLDTPYGQLKIQKEMGTLIVSGDWAPQAITDNERLVFRFEVASYGYRQERFSVRDVDTRIFARDCMRYNALRGPSSKAVPKEERRRLAGVICEQIELFYKDERGEQFAVSSQHNVLLVNLQNSVEKVRQAANELTRKQREAGQTFLDYLTLEATGSV